MRRITVLGFCAALLFTLQARADVTVMAVRVGAGDPVALAKFYSSVFGLKEINRIGGSAPMEIIMNFGKDVAAAKASTGPEFVVMRIDTAPVKDAFPRVIFHVPDINAAVTTARTAGATLNGEIRSLGDTGVKFVFVVDPVGNQIELIELPKGLDRVPVDKIK